LVGTGSKYETKEINGISHFLEHMMFKGTTKRPGTTDIARELDGIGAEYNAFTSKEWTGYYAKASSSKLEIIMDVVFDIFLNSKLSEEEIKIEKGVIIEEINMYKDDPPRYVADLYEELLYGDQPAGWSIAGTPEVVNSLKRGDFVKYFNTHYIAENTIVGVAGDIKPEEIKEKTENYFKHIRQDKPVKKLSVKEEQEKVKILLHHKKTDQGHFILGFRSFDFYNDKKYPLTVLAKILGGGMSSRLFDEVRGKRGLAYYVGAGNESTTDTGAFNIYAGVNNDKFYEAVEVIIQEVNKIKKNGITSEELQKAKDNIEGRTVLGLEHSDGVAMSYADSILFYNKVITPEEELKKIKAVTLEEVSDVANEIFKNNKLNLAVIGPHEDEQKLKSLLNVD
jgi:predicted Zn-dependent peptidase